MLQSERMTSQTQASARTLGASGPAVFPLALGCMGMSGMYGATDDDESLATIALALERGVTLLDTGDFYGVGHNELLLRRALAGRRERALLSLKFGVLRSPDGGWGGLDTRPAALKNFLAHSLTRLGTDYVDIYRPARLDPNVPIEDTVGAIADLVKAGYVRAIGLSEVGADTIRRAQAVHPICDVQLEYSLLSRGPERELLPLLAELGIGATTYGALSRGLLSGSRPQGRDFRAHLPRFAEDNLRKNQRLIDALGQLAQARGVSPSQLAIAWVLARAPLAVPVVGARTRRQLEEALGALDLSLTDDELRQLEDAVPAAAVAGARYDQHQMKILDSERAGSPA